MKSSLIEKYNVPVPRYTSYPPANHFTDTFTHDDYHRAIVESNSWQGEHISFYIHIPYCRHLCHYCGCNSYIYGGDEELERYIAALHKEIDTILPMLSKGRKIAQIHYGGGTPTAIPIKYLHDLNDHLMRDFETIDSPEIAIECHPAYLTEQDWRGLCEAGFNRFSLGIQDFDPAVLKGVNRRGPQVEVERIFEILRSHGAKVNMDFIYGLPLQSVEGFTQSISRAIALNPDRLVTFSYAHVPWVNKQQLFLEKLGLPSAELKDQLFGVASTLLRDAGYKTIGMDHFVREDDELYAAAQNRQLHRNFQGYCTRRTTGQVYAFGASAISQLAMAYAQNAKEPKRYIEMIEGGEYATIKGYGLSREEYIAREVIETLMCNNSVTWGDVASYLDLTVAEVKGAVNYNIESLEELTQDGLISFGDQLLEMTTEGLPFVRNVAASLDKKMINNTLSYSKPI
ncbi:MAG: oxygen-independent coproporphyrinogen III oxidase [Rikenellaceae bacterium]